MAHIRPCHRTRPQRTPQRSAAPLHVAQHGRSSLPLQSPTLPCPGCRRPSTTRRLVPSPRRASASAAPRAPPPPAVPSPPCAPRASPSAAAARASGCARLRTRGACMTHARHTAGQAGRLGTGWAALRQLGAARVRGAELALNGGMRTRTHTCAHAQCTCTCTRAMFLHMHVHTRKAYAHAHAHAHPRRRARARWRRGARSRSSRRT